MVDLLKAGGLPLGFVVAGLIVAGIALTGCQAQTPSKAEAKASPSAPKPAPEGMIPALDAEAPNEVATATFALG
jgi:hypothetical protein